MPAGDTSTHIAAVRSTLAEYSGTPITVRQLYYRLVAGGVIENSINSYKRLVSWLSGWRKNGEIPFGAFVDRTRELSDFDMGWHRHDPRAWLLNSLKQMRESYYDYDLNLWFGQHWHVVVAVEKQALEGVFEPICRELGVNLVVCRGYPSLSLLRDVGKDLNTRWKGQPADRQNVILYFGDFDPSGLNIPEAIMTSLHDVFQVKTEYEHIALEKEQIDQMNLIPAPVKLTDSRASRFMVENGEEVYELDAVEPRQLQEMIRKAVLDYYDNGAAEKRKEAIEEGREKIAELEEDHDLESIKDKLKEAIEALEAN
jgi:hypothetical protein